MFCLQTGIPIRYHVFLSIIKIIFKKSQGQRLCRVLSDFFKLNFVEMNIILNFFYLKICAWLIFSVTILVFSTSATPSWVILAWGWNKVQKVVKCQLTSTKKKRQIYYLTLPPCLFEFILDDKRLLGGSSPGLRHDFFVFTVPKKRRCIQGYFRYYFLSHLPKVNITSE